MYKIYPVDTYRSLQESENESAMFQRLKSANWQLSRLDQKLDEQAVYHKGLTALLQDLPRASCFFGPEQQKFILDPSRDDAEQREALEKFLKDVFKNSTSASIHDLVSSYHQEMFSIPAEMLIAGIHPDNLDSFINSGGSRGRQSNIYFVEDSINSTIKVAISIENVVQFDFGKVSGKLNATWRPTGLGTAKLEHFETDSPVIHMLIMDSPTQLSQEALQKNDQYVRISHYTQMYEEPIVTMYLKLLRAIKEMDSAVKEFVKALEESPDDQLLQNKKEVMSNGLQAYIKLLRTFENDFPIPPHTQIDSQAVAQKLQKFRQQGREIARQEFGFENKAILNNNRNFFSKFANFMVNLFANVGALAHRVATGHWLQVQDTNSATIAEQASAIFEEQPTKEVSPIVTAARFHR